MTTQRRTKDHPVFWVQRIGATVVALVLFAFAGLGFSTGAGFLATNGGHSLGMTGNGLLSTISVVVGVILLVSVIRSAPTASVASVILGILFVLSGLVNLWVLGTPHNYLAFTFPNIAFSLVIGLALMAIGLYGRASAQLPPDNPYRRANGGRNRLARLWHGEDFAQTTGDLSEEDEKRLARDAEMAEAEHAFAEGEATREQEQQVLADTAQRTADRRTEAWQRSGWTPGDINGEPGD